MENKVFVLVTANIVNMVDPQAYFCGFFNTLEDACEKAHVDPADAVFDASVPRWSFEFGRPLLKR